MVQTGNASLDPALSLRDPGGGELASDCRPDEVGVVNFQLRFTGTYTIRAFGCHDLSTGAYRLALTR